MKIKSRCLLFLILLSGLFLPATLMSGAAKSVLVNGKRASVEGDSLKLGPLSARAEVICRY
jgi:hypothetical protein